VVRPLPFIDDDLQVDNGSGRGVSNVDNCYLMVSRLCEKDVKSHLGLLKDHLLKDRPEFDDEVDSLDMLSTDFIRSRSGVGLPELEAMDNLLLGVFS